VNAAERRRKIARLRALARVQGDALTPEQIARLQNIDFLVDSADEEIDTLLDELGVADPDEGEPEEQEPAGVGAASVGLRAAIRSADRAGDRVLVARLRARYRALPLEQRRELLTAEQIDERSGRRVILAAGARRTRAVSASREVPADATAQPTLYGHFAVFDTWSEIESFWEGNFMESIAPGAFAKTIANDRAQMRVTLNHGRDPFLGNKVLGRIDALQEDKTGAAYEVALYRGIPDLVMEGLRDDAYGASFRFYIMQEQYTEKPKSSAYNPRAIPERVITEAMVEEFGPVTFPQYPEASAHLRSRIPERSRPAPAAASGRELPSRSRDQWLRSLSR